MGAVHVRVSAREAPVMAPMMQVVGQGEWGAWPGVETFLGVEIREEEERIIGDALQRCGRLSNALDGWSMLDGRVRSTAALLHRSVAVVLCLTPAATTEKITDEPCRSIEEVLTWVRVHLLGSALPSTELLEAMYSVTLLLSWTPPTTYAPPARACTVPPPRAETKETAALKASCEGVRMWRESTSEWANRIGAAAMG